MARIRTIKPDAWHDERLGQCSRDARLLWTVLITIADDEGRWRATPAIIAGFGYPYDPEALALLPGWLDELAGVGLIVLYGDPVGGRPQFGRHPRWTAHQRINKPTPSKLPPPPGATATPPESPREFQGDPGNPGPEVEEEREREQEEDAAAAASGASAHEAAGQPAAAAGGADQQVTPMAWPAVRAMLQGRGFGEEEIERDRRKIGGLLAETDRQLDWARGGQQLDEDRAAGRWQVHRPSAAVSYLLRQARPPLLGVPPAAPASGRGRRSAARQPAAAEHLAGPWAAVIEDARRQIADARWDTWLSVLEPIADTGGELTIYAPDHARSWIGDRLLPLLSASATRALDRQVTVVLHGHHDVRQAVSA